MGKLEGKVAVITGGSSGMALASAQRFVEEGAYVFITGRRQEALDEAVKLIGRNVTGVRGDAANLDDLDRLFDTVKREKGRIDILYASAGTGEAVQLGEITEQHFDATFGLNTRGTLFTVQKALPLFNDGGSIFMTGSVASIKGFPGYSVYAASKAALHAFARGWLNELKGRNIRVNVLHPGPIATPMQDQVLTEEAKQMFETRSPPNSWRRETGLWSSASQREKSKPRIGRSRTSGSSTLPFETAKSHTSRSTSTRKHWRGPRRSTQGPSQVRRVNRDGMTRCCADQHPFPERAPAYDFRFKRSVA